MNACSVQTNGYSPARSNACVQLPERRIGPESYKPAATRTSWVTKSAFFHVTTSPATTVERAGSKNLPGIEIVSLSACAAAGAASAAAVGEDDRRAPHRSTR